MRVLYVTHTNSLYGANRSLFSMLLEIKKLGVEPIVLLPHSHKPLFANLLKSNNIAFLSEHIYWWAYADKIQEHIKFYINYLLFHTKYPLLQNKIKRLHIDLIHSNSSVINIGAILANNLHIPHVWYLMEFGEEDFGLKFKYGLKKTSEFMERSSKRIIAISNAVRDKYKNYIKNKLVTIYLGAPKSNIIHREHRRRMDTPIRFLLAGQVHENKGQIVAIKALDILINKYNCRNVELWIAGKGKTRYMQALKKIILNKKLVNFVKILGFISDMESIRRECDIALMCSKQEAFGMVTVESMLAHMPVIGYNTGATKEIIIDGITGLLCNQGDYQDLCNKMMFFVKNPDMVSFFGNNGFRRAINNFTSEINARNLYKVYREVLS